MRQTTTYLFFAAISNAVSVNKSVQTVHLPRVGSHKGDTCLGLNETTGEPFPDCGPGLQCVDWTSGEGNICVPKPKAYVGEECHKRGLRGDLSLPFCADGLNC